MDEPNPKPLAKPTHGGTPPKPTVQTAAAPAAPASPASPAGEHWLARGSGHISDAPVSPERRERPEHSVMEGLPEAKAERIASIYRELAETQRQLSAAQQRIATELQGRAEDADRAEALEARLQAQELEAKKVAARVAELETDIAGLRSQLASATTTAEELRRDIAARDTQIEEARRQHREVTEKLEVQSASLRETKTLLETRDAELATRTTERDTEQATKSRLERELEDERKQHLEAIATRDTALAAITSERDAVKAELDTARRELDAGRAKARDVMSQLARLGQELDGAVAVPSSSAERPQRSQPPPVPSTRAAAHTDAKPVEAILEVTEEAKPARSRIRSGLLMLGGAILGCALTIAIAKASTSSSTTAGHEEELGAPPPAALAVPVETQPAAEPASDPQIREAIAEPSAAATPAAQEPDPGANARSEDKTTQAPSEPVRTDGVIVLPDAAEGHRVYVDGRKVDVKGSRAVVPCGTRAIQIGSRGTARTIEVACGGETAVPADPRDR